MSDVYIDSLDFNRVMSIFLDNAIEAASVTDQKSVSLVVQRKRDKSKLFILSNDTIEPDNTKDIFSSGYTTKRGHAGQGLVMVRSILNKYGNVTLNLTCYDNRFTVYFDLKPMTSI